MIIKRRRRPSDDNIDNRQSNVKLIVRVWNRFSWGIFQNINSEFKNQQNVPISINS